MLEPLSMNIIIPTRERADTLFWTLKTCVGQDYENLNIIVCDNFSNDNTLDVVRSFDDSRINYVNSGRRLSMTQNWEFALSQVTAGYVTVIGDDDGLLPNSVRDVSLILQSEKLDALSWMKSEYCWPNHVLPEWKNFLSIPLGPDLIEMRSKTVLRNLSRFLLPYNRTPTLYNSFVDYGLIEAIKRRTGSFLHSVAPDIYSGIALLSEIDRYLYSIRPYSVNGASSHSNGTSVNSTQSKEAVEKFMKESMPEETEMLGLVTGSVYSVFAESLFQANTYCHGGQLPVSKKIVLFFIVREMANKGEDAFEVAKGDLHLFAKRHKLTAYLNFLLKVVKTKRIKENSAFEWGLDRRNILNIDASKFEISNVYEASRFVESVLGSNPNKKRLKYSGMSRFYSRLLRGVRSSNIDVTL